MELHSCKLTVLTVCLLISGMVIPASAFAQPVDAQYDIYDELTIEMPDNELYVHDEIIVKFSPGVSKEKIANINARNGAKVKYTSPYADFKVLKIPENKNPEKMAEVYNKNPNVEYAVPNAIMTACAAATDPLYELQWNLHDPNGINIEPAWDISTGEGVIVAVLDTGVAYENYEGYTIAPDLTSTNFIAGWDFINNDEHANDDHYHGTHVAGTIAQSTNNGEGVAGVAYDCTVMPVKVLDTNGSGNLSQLVHGIYFATDNGADVISMSLGYPPRYYPGSVLDQALDYAYNNGVTIVAAAGNDGTRYVSYPAAYEKCIAVGATGYDGTLAPYSNYGTELDVVAPGGNTGQDLNYDGYGDGILQNTINPYTKDPTDFSYWFFDGTSMATPHVSGVAALLISQGASNDEVRDALESSARDLGRPGADKIYGYGLIDAKAALDHYLNTQTTPINNPPVADAGGPYTGYNDTAIAFDGSASTDSDGSIASYYWEFGDGITGSGVAPTHTYNSIGDYAVNLTVTDDNGATDTTSTTVSVTIPPANVAPTADAGGQYTGYKDTVITFDGSGSTDSDGNIISYYWEFGDGSTGNGVAPTHTYNSVGDYTVNLTVTDDDDATDTATATVSVTTATEPTITIESVVIRDRTAGGKNTFVHAEAVVNILNDIPEKQITGYWTGATTETVSAVTDGSGKLTFYSNEVKFRGTELNFIFTIGEETLSATYPQ